MNITIFNTKIKLRHWLKFVCCYVIGIKVYVYFMVLLNNLNTRQY